MEEAEQQQRQKPHNGNDDNQPKQLMIGFEYLVGGTKDIKAPVWIPGRAVEHVVFRVPEPQNDMIFAIICEELGLFGGLAVIFMFVLLLFRLRDIVYYTTDLFGSLLVCGVFAHIAIQVVLNVAVVTNTIPNTGISLPFISYGGSSVIFLLAEIGIVMNVASNIDFATPNVNYQETIDEEN